MAAGKQKVGYKKPPKHSQFKKGQSGNPGGRRRLASGSIRDALAEVLQSQQQDGITYAEHVALNLVKEATWGKPASVALILREFE